MKSWELKSINYMSELESSKNNSTYHMSWWPNKLNKKMSTEIENSPTVQENKVQTFKSIPMKISNQKNQAKEHKNNPIGL